MYVCGCFHVRDWLTSHFLLTLLWDTTVEHIISHQYVTSGSQLKLFSWTDWESIYNIWKRTKSNHITAALCTTLFWGYKEVLAGCQVTASNIRNIMLGKHKTETSVGRGDIKEDRLICEKYIYSPNCFSEYILPFVWIIHYRTIFFHSLYASHRGQSSTYQRCLNCDYKCADILRCLFHVLFYVRLSWGTSKLQQDTLSTELLVWEYILWSDTSFLTWMSFWYSRYTVVIFPCVTLIHNNIKIIYESIN